MIELACKEALFSFNKKHLEDSSIPMWILTTKGKSYYVNHVTSNLSWSTREAPDKSTKGAIKFKNVLLKIDDDNNAECITLTASDAARLRAKNKGYIRILVTSGSRIELFKFIEDSGIKFTTIKAVPGRCGSTFYICDIKDKNSITAMQLAHPHHFRILQENELYYRAYDDSKLLNQLQDDDYADDYIEEE